VGLAHVSGGVELLVEREVNPAGIAEVGMDRRFDCLSRGLTSRR
jgi:hypothetical protein